MHSEIKSAGKTALGGPGEPREDGRLDLTAGAHTVHPGFSALPPSLRGSASSLCVGGRNSALWLGDAKGCVFILFPNSEISLSNSVSITSI